MNFVEVNGNLKVSNICSFIKENDEEIVTQLGFFVFDDDNGVGISLDDSYKLIRQLSKYDKFKVTIEPME